MLRRLNSYILAGEIGFVLGAAMYLVAWRGCIVVKYARHCVVAGESHRTGTTGTRIARPLPAPRGTRNMIFGWHFSALGWPYCHVTCARNYFVVLWDVGKEHETSFKLSMN